MLSRVIVNLKIHVPPGPKPLDSSMYLRRFPQLRTLQSHSFHSSSHLRALSPLAIQKAEQISFQWKGTSATGGTTKNFIGGEFVESKTTQWIDAHDPVRNTLKTSYLLMHKYLHSQHKLSSRAFHKPQIQNSKTLSTLLLMRTNLGVVQVS